MKSLKIVSLLIGTLLSIGWLILAITLLGNWLLAFVFAIITIVFATALLDITIEN